jgi:phosphoenolpyruvate synthase/pyruvate phosphate dikinase
MKSITLQFDATDARKLAVGSILMQHFRIIISEFAPDMVTNAENELNQLASMHTSNILKHLNSRLPEIRKRHNELLKQYEIDKQIKAMEKYSIQVKEIRGRSASDMLPLNLSQRIDDVIDVDSGSSDALVDSEKVIASIELLHGLKDIVKSNFNRFKSKMRAVLGLNTIQKAKLQELPVPSLDDDIDFIIKLLSHVQ